MERIIKFAEFYPVSNGAEVSLPRMKDLMERGYSILVFPEGTRSADCSIGRFHKGAFYLANELKADIVPLFIHGFGHVLPKNDFMLRPGSLFMQVDKRISYNDYKEICGPQYDAQQDRALTSYFGRYYRSHYKELCSKLETVEYFIPYATLKYYYKGADVEARARKIFKLIKKGDLSPLPDKYSKVDSGCNDKRGIVWIKNSGQGEFALIFALAYTEYEVYAFERDYDSAALAANISSIPHNLHFVHLCGDSLPDSYSKADYCIDVNNLIKGA